MTKYLTATLFSAALSAATLHTYLQSQRLMSLVLCFLLGALCLMTALMTVEAKRRE